MDGVKRRDFSKHGCLVRKTSIHLIGNKVGGNMSRKQAWKEVVDKVLSRLSRWKMKLLSIGGRLTLLKSVLGSMPIFHMSIFKVPSSILKSLESIRSRFFNGQDPKSNKASWVKWNKVLTPKDKGGLGVSSLFALNRGLMLKWVWRFYSQKFPMTKSELRLFMGDGILEQGCFWWSLNLLYINSVTEDLGFAGISDIVQAKGCWKELFLIRWWSIWSFRNRCIFDLSPPKRSTLFDDIVSLDEDSKNKKGNRKNGDTWKKDGV
ncbi:hypothetical protein Tco_0174874 [Tanacetum coccineum]